MTFKPLPKPSFLDNLDHFVYNNEKRWHRSDRKRIYTWDGLHGEIEVFNNRGKHLGSLDPVTGVLIKEAVKGRTIDV